MSRTGPDPERPTDPATQRVAVRSGSPLPHRPRAVPDPEDLYQPDPYGQNLLRSLMRAQLGVTIAVLLPAAALVATYPVLSSLLPGLASASMGPLPLSVVILGFAIYPPLVGLALLYVRRARRVEDRFVDLLHEQ